MPKWAVHVLCKYDEEEVVEKQLVATGDAPRLQRKENMAEDWKTKAEISFVQDDGMDDAKEAIEANREDVIGNKRRR